METKELCITMPRMSRRERAKRVRKEALNNISAIILAWFYSLPTIIYRNVLHMMACTIIMFLFIGAMLFAFCFCMAAGAWFCTFIPWPA